MQDENEKFMKIAIEQAKKAYNKGEIPVGAVIVKNNKIISKAYNVKEEKKDCTYHAEIIAIKKASIKLNNWRLNNCKMYVTLEPCAMCAGAIINSRIKEIYIGTMDKNLGACGSITDLFKTYKLENKVIIIKEILQNECEGLLKDFFKELRRGEIKNADRK